MRLRIILVAAAMALPVLSQDVPRPAPDLVIHFPGQLDKNLKSYRGKVVAIEFLLTTCPHCQETAQNLNLLYGEYGAKGFQPIGVAFNPDAAKLAPAFAKNLGLNFPVGVGSSGDALDFMQLFPFMQISAPLIAFVDRGGTIRAQYTGGDEFFLDPMKNMRAVIEGLLKEPPPKPLAQRGVRKHKQ